MVLLSGCLTEIEPTKIEPESRLNANLPTYSGKAD